MVKDWRGNEYEVGSKVIYGCVSNHSVEIVEGEVVEIRPTTITVRVLGSAQGRVARWAQRYGRDKRVLRKLANVTVVQ